MKCKKTSVAAALIVAATMGSAASAATIYATGIDWTNNGTVGSSNNRDNKLNALGAPDGQFMSLGLVGAADFTFGQDFISRGTVWEVTFGTRASYLETAEVLLSYQGSNFVKVADIGNASASGSNFTFNGRWDTLRLVDTTPGSSPSTDGYDVDAVGVSPVPIPAAGFLLLGALGGLAAMRLRRKAA